MTSFVPFLHFGFVTVFFQFLLCALFSWPRFFPVDSAVNKSCWWILQTMPLALHYNLLPLGLSKWCLKCGLRIYLYCFFLSDQIKIFFKCVCGFLGNVYIDYSPNAWGNDSKRSLILVETHLVIRHCIKHLLYLSGVLCRRRDRSGWVEWISTNCYKADVQQIILLKFRSKRTNSGETF